MVRRSSWYDSYYIVHWLIDAMGDDSLWDQVWLPLLIGVAIQIIGAALCFLSVRLWNCLMEQIKTQTAVGENAHDQPLPDSDAAAHANGVPDMEMGNGYGPAEGGESEVELRIVNSSEAPMAQVMRDAATGALVPVETNIPHSHKRKLLKEAPVEKGWRCWR